MARVDKVSFEWLKFAQHGVVHLASGVGSPKREVPYYENRLAKPAAL